VSEAYESDLVENDVKKLVVDNGLIKAKILPFGYLTLHLVGGSRAAQVEDLTATAMSGEKVRLQWSSDGGNDRYEVFRSDDSRDPTTQYTSIGTVMVPEFNDDGLDPGTTYYYRVVAVTRDNTGGPESAQAKVTTQIAASEPPAPVKGLNVIRLSPTRLVVSWRKSPEKDAARYYLYRGDQDEFDPTGTQPLAILTKSGYFLETFVDSGLQPDHKYFYRVYPENWSGMRQAKSDAAAATTPHP
jgi:fibronectin type 3 domain-containing protein